MSDPELRYPDGEAHIIVDRWPLVKYWQEADGRWHEKVIGTNVRLRKVSDGQSDDATGNA